MAVTEALRILDRFEQDEDDSRYQGGTLGLHLGVLRRLAMLALQPPAADDQSDMNR